MHWKVGDMVVASIELAEMFPALRGRIASVTGVGRRSLDIRFDDDGSTLEMLRPSSVRSAPLTQESERAERAVGVL